MLIGKETSSISLLFLKQPLVVIMAFSFLGGTECGTALLAAEFWRKGSISLTETKI